MEHIFQDDRGAWMIDPYIDYLNANADALPPGVRAYALASWHYLLHEHQCPHDAWLEEFVIREKASGARRQIRTIEIEARFLGAYHDGEFTFTYQGVTGYRLDHMRNLDDQPPGYQPRSHEDLLIDELVLLPTGGVRHEIIFATGDTWQIDFADLTYHWKPIVKG